jgi:diguanylate cyclase (GGDEF)-like protein/putative nucleotidyltransferase with HDIG domain
MDDRSRNAHLADAARQHRRVAAMRVAGGVLILLVVVVAVVAVLIERSVSSDANQARRLGRLSHLYHDARYWVGQEDSLENMYRLEPGAAVLAKHSRAERNLTTDLRLVARLDTSAATVAFVERLVRTNKRYARVTEDMFAAVRAGNRQRMLQLDRRFGDPALAAVETAIYARAATSSNLALGQGAALESKQREASRESVIGLVAALILLGLFVMILSRSRRVEHELRAGEIERLKQLALTDPLTGLRNHRAFHEDLAQELQRAGRSGTPVSLVIFDLIGLKQINDTRGLQDGDKALRSLASALSDAPRATDRAYRIGGDEFAVILWGCAAWDAFQFAQRQRVGRDAHDGSDEPVASAGIAQATGLRTKDEVLREAGLALAQAKRDGKDVVVFSSDMARPAVPAQVATGDDQTRTLARALALAVDTKDSYTRSHSQTVATLCALLAGELGLDDALVTRLRLAGLLHDVGKIGIPDTILKKPAKLSAEEFEVMKSHTVLGERIVLAAELPVEAGWIRHHHERIDGTGYPDGLAAEEIPLEARIIHVADAFEAMTSDRPYRDAPGQEFAVQELRRHADRQFDSRVVEAMIRVLDAQPGDGEEEPSTFIEAHGPLALEAPGPRRAL